MSDVSVVKEGDTIFITGQPLSYTITVTNTGPAAVNDAIVTDTFPSQLTEVTWECRATSGSSCTVTGEGDISDAVNLLPEGKVVYAVEAVVEVGSPTPIENTATVTVPDDVVDYDPDNNQSTWYTDRGDVIFGDGFESGDSDVWSSVPMGKMSSQHQEAPDDETAPQSMHLDAGER